MYVVEIIPFSNFRNRMQLMKTLHNCKVEVFGTYLYVERVEKC